MSIALEAKVDALERHVATLSERLEHAQCALIETNNHLLRANDRIAELERTAQRKPGPKSKDASNG
jgi:septal ring factor EnvC (AmiA/AmiB activator)